MASEKCSALLPDVPTAKESGLPGYLASSWNALAVPARTPKDVVARLNRDIAAVRNSPEVKNRLHELNVEARDLLVSEIKRWGEVIQRANIPKQ